MTFFKRKLLWQKKKSNPKPNKTEHLWSNCLWQKKMSWRHKTFLWGSPRTSPWHIQVVLVSSSQVITKGKWKQPEAQRPEILQICSGPSRGFPTSQLSHLLTKEIASSNHKARWQEYWYPVSVLWRCAMAAAVQDLVLQLFPFVFVQSAFKSLGPCSHGSTSTPHLPLSSHLTTSVRTERCSAKEQLHCLCTIKLIYQKKIQSCHTLLESLKAVFPKLHCRAPPPFS